MNFGNIISFLPEPQVLFIDMMEVTEEERQKIDYMVNDFNDQVEDIYNRFEEELENIETERKFQLRDLNVPENIAALVNDLEAQVK